MSDLQIQFLMFFTLVNIFLTAKGFWETYYRQNAYGLTPWLLPIGIFVWADAVVFGVFWTIVGAIGFFTQDWILFCLFYSLFWLVRSLGETIYWFNQQFSTLNRNDPAKMRFFKYFKNDSIWFVYQIFHQCVTIFSIVASLYFAKLWLIG